MTVSVFFLSTDIRLKSFNFNESSFQSREMKRRATRGRNGYPNHVVNSTFTRKLQDFKRPVKFGSRKCSIFLFLSWRDTVSTKFEKRNTSSVCCCYFAVEPRVVFTTRQLFPATKKEVLRAFQHSNINYQYLCHCDSLLQNCSVFSKSIGPFSFLQIFQSFGFP